MECKNCGKIFEGKFCNECGQNVRVAKLTTKSFFEELSDSIFQINKGLFYTIKCMFIRPGHTIRDFLNGQRKKHFKPIAFALTLSTVYFLVSQFSDSPTLMDDFLSGFSAGGRELELNTHESPILIWLSDNYAYTTILMIPVFSLASFISFFGLKRNYLEHIVINSFITGQQAIFYSVFMIFGVSAQIEDITVLLAFVISILFNCWTFIQFFQEEKKGLVILRLILSYLLFYIFFSVVLFVIIIPYL